ncbi:RNA polymerase sigma factor [Solirubrobacter phytolaccae]|uniref:RNA polymerase sigma factor n=1 Tax=Solirubrobacter phytolaccae TaxID=1404360 RepID=A0A9X3N956_9ACTN|nr:RNA polymerase sigma factor [Solirubrobacter phytolaccae]
MLTHEDTFATEFERHRPVLRRHAGRLLRGSGHDPDDVVQDVYLRADTALRGGVVPIDTRAWLLRLVRNASLDELRRAKVRAAAGDVELETLPSASGQLPEVLVDRTEARELLGDIHRLPDRQKSVLVMSALDGLSHEEVAVRLDTTVDTTRSLLARARANLRQTAEARETSCVSVRDALEMAADGGVRASEIARRHLWSCAGCRAHQALLRERPSRLRRLAGWSPWGVLAQLIGGGSVATVQKVAVGTCCALVLGGSAVTVPVVKHHASEEPQLAMVTPADLDAADRPRAAHKPKRSEPGKAVVVDSTPTAVATRSAVTATTKKATPKRKARRVPATPRSHRFDDRKLYLHAVKAFMRTNPTPEEQQAFFARAKKFHLSPPGSKARRDALANIAREAYKPRQAPPKGLARPVPSVATPVPTVVATPVATPVETPTVAPTVVPTVVATAVPTETAVATPTETASPVPVE